MPPRSARSSRSSRRGRRRAARSNASRSSRGGTDVVKRYRGGIVRRFWHRVSAIIARILRREHEDERAHLTAERAARARDLGIVRGADRADAGIQFRGGGARAHAGRDPARMTQSLDYLFSDPDGGGVSADAKAHALSVAPRWCALYAFADVLAQERQRQFVMGLEAPVRGRPVRLLLLCDLLACGHRVERRPGGLQHQLRRDRRAVRARADRTAPGALSRLPGARRGAARGGVLEAHRHRGARCRCQGADRRRPGRAGRQSGRGDGRCLSDHAVERARLGEGVACAPSSGSTSRSMPRRRAGSIRSGTISPGGSGCAASWPISGGRASATTPSPRRSRPMHSSSWRSLRWCWFRS